MASACKAVVVRMVFDISVVLDQWLFFLAFDSSVNSSDT